MNVNKSTIVSRHKKSGAKNVNEDSFLNLKQFGKDKKSQNDFCSPTNLDESEKNLEKTQKVKQIVQSKIESSNSEYVLDSKNALRQSQLNCKKGTAIDMEDTRSNTNPTQNKNDVNFFL